MKKKQLLLKSFLACMLLLPGFLMAQNNFRTAKSAREAVAKEVTQSRFQWINMFPEDDLASYGFNNIAEIEKAIPGQPIEVFHQFRNEKGVIEKRSSGAFLVPLMLDGKARVFITVAFFENRYQVVSLGEMNLAVDAADFISNNNLSAAGHKLIWLKNLNQAADFIAEENIAAPDSEIQLTPLFTAKRASFNEPLQYKALVERIKVMPVSSN